MIAQEYLAAHKEHNDPATRVNVLLSQLTDIVAELVPLVDARDQLHRRLAQEYWLLPADEKSRFRRAGRSPRHQTDLHRTP